MAAGNLNLNQTAIGAIPAANETFSYDPTGNWTAYTRASDGSTDLDQTRVNNRDNQLTIGVNQHISPYGLDNKRK